MLSELLSFRDDEQIQDWERHFADEARIGEFLELYESGQLKEDEKCLLMDLVLASAAFAVTGHPSGAQWERIEQILLHDSAIHARTVWEWASIDEDTGIPDNDFQISPRMQRLYARIQTAGTDGGGFGGECNGTEFAAFWNKNFHDHVPIGYLLRNSLKNRWVRFHSLPESKRYAETEEEWAILLDRQNRLATRVLGEGSRCWLVLPRTIDAEDAVQSPHLDRFDFAVAFNWSDRNDPGFPVNKHINIAEIDWRPGEFDSLLRVIANWEDVSMAFISRKTGAIFAPYDGGMDVILKSKEEVTSLCAEFNKWRSSHPEGL